MSRSFICRPRPSTHHPSSKLQSAAAVHSKLEPAPILNSAKCNTVQSIQSFANLCYNIRGPVPSELASQKQGTACSKLHPFFRNVRRMKNAAFSWFGQFVCLASFGDPNRTQRFDDAILSQFIECFVEFYKSLAYLMGADHFALVSSYLLNEPDQPKFSVSGRISPSVSCTIGAN